MKKYYIRDDDEQEYEVVETEVEEPIEEPVEDEGIEALSEEDIATLKMLASVADKLVALIQEKEAPVEEPIEEEEIDEDIVEDADEEIEEKEEEVIDTRKCDSKKSFGALEKRTKTADSDLTDDVADAWAKRYGGK